MSEKQNLGPGSTKDRLDAALEWNAATERQAGKKRPEEASAKARREDDDRKRAKPEGS